MTSLELLQEIDAWLSFNNSPSKEQISELRNDIKKHISEQLKLHVSHCGLTEIEYAERERLLELQRSRTRWFSQQEFDRLKELSEKMFANAGSPHST